MKKTYLSLLASLLLFAFFVTQQSNAQSSLAPVTATYNYAYKYDEASASYNWDDLLQSPVTINWTAQPLPDAAADGSPQYKVTLIMSSWTKNYSYENWSLSLYNVDSWVSANTTYLTGTTVLIGQAFGNTPQGTRELILKLAPPPPNISYFSYGNTGMVYTEKIINGNTTIVPPDQITFSAYYKGNQIEANAPVYHTAYAIQRDQ